MSTSRTSSGERLEVPTPRYPAPVDTVRTFEHPCEAPGCGFRGRFVYAGPAAGLTPELERRGTDAALRKWAVHVALKHPEWVGKVRA